MMPENRLQPASASVVAIEEWKHPSRGRVGMFGLIAAESSIFTIFVVAYLFYMGKSVSGPLPREVLSVPVFYTICLLSSSLTIHLAVRALRSGKARAFSGWWLTTCHHVSPGGHGESNAVVKKEKPPLSTL